MKIMKKRTNWLYNWVIKLPAWALCTAVIVSAATALTVGLIGALFIIAGVEKVIVVSDCIIGVTLCISGLFFLYFTLNMIDAFFDQLTLTEEENNKKHKDKSKD